MNNSKPLRRLAASRDIGPLVIEYYKELRKAKKRGRLVAWCFGSVPSLILRAADIEYLWGNQYAAMATARGIEDKLQDPARQHGFSDSLCSYCRSMLGNALQLKEEGSFEDQDVKEDYFPIAPDLVVSLNPHCHNNMLWADAIRRQFECPTFYFQIPHEWERGEWYLKEAKAWTVEQHKKFIELIEKLTGRKYPYERLKELMVEAKAAGIARYEAMQLCRNIPSPATYFDWLNSLAPVNLLAGVPGTAAVMEKIRAEIEMKVQKKEGAVVNEKYRLYYDGLGPYPVMGEVARRFAELGANVICGRYVHLGFFNDADKFDPDQPLETLSEGLLTDFQLNWALDHIIEEVCKLCEDYAIDGLVFQIPKTCRSTSNRQIELMEAVSSKLDLPVALMDGDQTDRSFYNVEEMFEEVRSLLRAIDARRKH